MKTLRLEISDDIHHALQQQATMEGKAIEAVAIEWLAAHLAPLRSPTFIRG